MRRFFARKGPTIKRIEVLDLRPGDLLILEADRPITEEQAARIRREFEKKLGEVTVVVVEGLTPKVVRREEVAA